jgi:hypothetical protein
MPPVRQMVSPNYTATLIKHDLFVFWTAYSEVKRYRLWLG